jgi:iron complex outermembrane recepter protein
MAGRFHSEHPALLSLAACVATVLAAPAQAEEVRRFTIPAGRLSDGLLRLAEQAGISIAIEGRGLDAQRTRGLNGRFTAKEALRRLLSGSGYSFAFTNGSTVRIVATSVPVRSSSLRQTASRPVLEATDPEIVVSATKQRVGIADYPASISVVDLDETDGARGGAQGTGYILRRLPGLASTNLGPGRNKIFIRGIADSSFNGDSQSTISQYLGEARLIYSAPDPDLLLYDIERVEVLEGPQGTLYGAGTLGGIIRLVPRAPDLSDTSLAVSGGVRLTHEGSPGYDGAMLGNLPLAEGSAALRVVVYHSTEGGYIDDLLRDRDDVNRNRISGVRASVRWKPGADWTFDAGLVAQNLSSRDGQYSEADVGERSRASAIAQPFDNDYWLATLTVRREWGGKELLVANTYTRQSIDTVFDATATPGVTAPLEYQEDAKIELFSHETRLSGGLGRSGRWLAGLSIVNNIDRSARRLGEEGNPALIAQVANTTLDSAAFGETTVPLLTKLYLTLGGRLSYIRQTSEFRGETAPSGFEPRRRQLRALPTVALAWKPTSAMLAYGRYQEGYRPGALQIAGTVSDPVAQRFSRDHIRTVELGWRFGTRPGSALSGGITASLARWSDIQADLVNEAGLPYIANIGSGRVRNVAVTLVWRPGPDTSLEAAGFIASSNLSKPAFGFDAALDRDLPNIADEGLRIGGRQSFDIGGHDLTIDGALRYVGSSKLAIRPPFDLPQGRYYDLSAGARLDLGRFAVSLDLENLLDSEANTFAFGNPFSVARGKQSTPLRPRSIRIGFDTSF